MISFSKDKDGCIVIPDVLEAELEALSTGGNGRNLWTEEEDAVLKKYYRKTGPQKLVRFFKDHKEELGSSIDRTLNAIRHRATTLNLTILQENICE